jgi:hypothetical protein
MVNVKGTRKIRAVVSLICAKLQIDDKELDAFIGKGTVKPIKAGKK